MDPQVVWTAMLAALSERELPAAMETAESLASWLSRGGFAPQVLAELSAAHPLQRILAETVCTYVLQLPRDAPEDG